MNVYTYTKLFTHPTDRTILGLNLVSIFRNQYHLVSITLKLDALRHYFP